MEYGVCLGNALVDVKWILVRPSVTRTGLDCLLGGSVRGKTQVRAN